jgi:hypothetical protein
MFLRELLVVTCLSLQEFFQDLLRASTLAGGNKKENCS